MKVICNSLCDFLAVCTHSIHFHAYTFLRPPHTINQPQLNAYLGLNTVKIQHVPTAPLCSFNPQQGYKETKTLTKMCSLPVLVVQ